MACKCAHRLYRFAFVREAASIGAKARSRKDFDTQIRHTAPRHDKGAPCLTKEGDQFAQPPDVLHFAPVDTFCARHRRMARNKSRVLELSRAKGYVVAGLGRDDAAIAQYLEICAH